MKTNAIKCNITNITGINWSARKANTGWQVCYLSGPLAGLGWLPLPLSADAFAINVRAHLGRLARDAS